MSCIIYFSMLVFQLSITRDILYKRTSLSSLIAMVSQGLTSSSWDVGKATSSIFTLINAKSLIISRKSFISTPSFSPLFTNLSDIINDHTNSLSLLVLFHISVTWSVKTYREMLLNHKAAAIHQSIFHMMFILLSSNGNWREELQILWPMKVQVWWHMSSSSSLFFAKKSFFEEFIALSHA